MRNPLVSTRTMAALGLFAVFLSTGMGWLGASGNDVAVFTGLDVYSEMGLAYGICHCPPDNGSLAGEVSQLALPHLAPPGILFPGIVLLPASVFASLVAFLRLRITIVAGALAVAGSGLWITGVVSLGPALSSSLNTWQTAVLAETGSAAPLVPYSVDPSFGPYVLAAGGLILILTYYFDRKEVLDPSEDWL